MKAWVFLRFCAVGVINTAVGLSVIFLLMRAGVDYITANLLGYLCGIVNSFFWNKKWTFEHKGPILKTAVLWGVAVAMAYLLNLSVVIFFHRFIGVDAYIAQLLGNVAYTVFSFLLARSYVFKAQEA